MDKLKIPKKSKIRDLVHDYICSKTGHPVDIASGKVTTEHIDFAFPGPIPFEWKRWYSSASSYDGPLGVGWHHPYDMALAEDHRVVAVRMEDGRVLLSARLGVGESHYDRSEKRTLFRDERGYGLRDHAERTTHRFGKAERDGVQRLTSIENDFGEAIQLEYDNDLFLTGIVDSAGRRIRLVNDHRGKIRSILVSHPTLPGEEGERPSVEIVQYLVDSAHDLVEVFDAQKRPWKFRYANHLLISETLRNGLTFQFQYKGSGITARCVRTWGDGGIYDHKLKYNLVQGHTVVTTSLGARTEHHHENGVVREVVDALGGRSSTLWNAWMEPFATLDELGRGTLTEFDDRGNPTKMIEVDGSSLEVAYEDDLPVSAIDAVGGQWLWKHDQGRLVERTDPLGRITRYEYDGSRLIALVDAKGTKTEFAYDPQGNLVKATFPDGSTSEWIHDRWGHLWSAVDERGNRRDFAYDLSGNLRKIREPDGNLREMDYDPEDNLIRAKDAHREVSFTWRGMGAMASRTENGTRIDFAYDTEDQLTAIRNEVQDIYGFKRDVLGRVELEQGWDGLRRTFRYDAVGNLVRVERPGERWTEYDNDAAGRVLEVRHWDESSESFVYRPDGELVEATNAHAKILWERDTLGRVLKEVQGNYWVESIWNELDERVEIRSSLGAHQIIDRDLMGEATSVQVPGNPEDPAAPPKWEARFQRDLSGLEIERALPGGIKSRWERDQHGRPLRHSFGKKDKERTREYSWEVDDRLKKIVDSAYGPVEFEHDAFGNLSGATYNDFHKLWRAPDVLGNLFRTPERLDRKYGPSGQLLESTSTQGLTRYEYDAEGNLVKKTITPLHSPEPTMVLGSGTGLGSGPNADKIWLYEWNAAGHLSRVIRPDGQVVESPTTPWGAAWPRPSRAVPRVGSGTATCHCTNGKKKRESSWMWSRLRPTRWTPASRKCSSFCATRRFRRCRHRAHRKGPAPNSPSPGSLSPIRLRPWPASKATAARALSATIWARRWPCSTTRATRLGHWTSIFTVSRAWWKASARYAPSATPANTKTPRPASTTTASGTSIRKPAGILAKIRLGLQAVSIYSPMSSILRHGLISLVWPVISLGLDPNSLAGNMLLTIHTFLIRHPSVPEKISPLVKKQRFMQRTEKQMEAT
ncbi:MAG: RHS repeat protein [Fibrobacterota bacterium]|nr:MAG: RHS repeat protein [Fibrobacterota bacterium]